MSQWARKRRGVPSVPSRAPASAVLLGVCAGAFTFWPHVASCDIPMEVNEAEEVEPFTGTQFPRFLASRQALLVS